MEEQRREGHAVVANVGADVDHQFRSAAPGNKVAQRVDHAFSNNSSDRICRSTVLDTSTNIVAGGLLARASSVSSPKLIRYRIASGAGFTSKKGIRSGFFMCDSSRYQRSATLVPFGRPQAASRDAADRSGAIVVHLVEAKRYF